MINALVALAKNLHRFVFDFSANDNNRREVEDILIAALEESKTDLDFFDMLEKVFIRYEGGIKEGDARYMAFRRFMYEHERPGEHLAPNRVRAAHLLEDLPRIFGDKTKGQTITPHVHGGAHNSPEPTMKEKTDDV